MIVIDSLINRFNRVYDEEDDDDDDRLREIDWKMKVCVINWKKSSICMSHSHTFQTDRNG